MKLIFVAYVSCIHSVLKFIDSILVSSSISSELSIVFNLMSKLSLVSPRGVFVVDYLIVDPAIDELKVGFTLSFYFLQHLSTKSPRNRIQTELARNPYIARV